MEKSISIPYTLSGQGTNITIGVSYNIVKEGEIQTVSCNLNTTADGIPLWLQPHKFEVKSVHRNGVYETLFNYDERIKSLDAALFIDKAYADIMLKERCKIMVELEA